MVGLVASRCRNVRREARFADAGFARQQHHLSFARLRLGPAPKQEFGFFLSPDERGQPLRVKGRRTGSPRAPDKATIGARRSRHAFEVLRAEVVEFEKVAEEFARALGNDDACRMRRALQPGRQIGRVADDAVLLGLSRADQVADDHEPRRDADAYMQGRAGGGLQLRRRLDDRKAGPHSALGVVLVRLRIAEIGEHAVAHVFGDEAAARSVMSVAQHRW